METQPATRAARESHGGAVDEFGAVMTRSRVPYALVGVDPESFDRIDLEPFARPARTNGVTFFTRPFDKQEADYFTGNHEVILRQRGFPVGEQEPIGGAYPVVYRPRALPWDCGTALNVTTGG